MPDKISDNDIKKALECLSGTAKDWDCDKCPFDSAICTSFVAENTLDYINRLEAEKKELQELVDDMGDYFPACIDCEGKTPLGERTDKCVYKLNNTNYCTKRGIATIFSIRNENRELKAENEKLKNSLAISEKETRRYVTSYKTAKAEANKEFAERLCAITKAVPEMRTYYIRENDFDNLLKEMVGE